MSSILVGGAKKSKSFDLDFFICVRRTQHHLTVGQHHYERSEYVIVRLRTQMNDVVLCINGVGLCPMMLRFAQTGSDFIMQLFVIFDEIQLMKKVVVTMLIKYFKVELKIFQYGIMTHFIFR